MFGWNKRDDDEVDDSALRSHLYKDIQTMLTTCKTRAEELAVIEASHATALAEFTGPSIIFRDYQREAQTHPADVAAVMAQYEGTSNDRMYQLLMNGDVTQQLQEIERPTATHTVVFTDMPFRNTYFGTLDSWVKKVKSMDVADSKLLLGNVTATVRGVEYSLAKEELTIVETLDVDVDRPIFNDINGKATVTTTFLLNINSDLKSITKDLKSLTFSFEGPTGLATLQEVYDDLVALADRQQQCINHTQLLISMLSEDVQWNDENDDLEELDDLAVRADELVNGRFRMS